MKIVSYKMRASDIKAFASPDTYFFTRKTMQFWNSKIYSGYRVDPCDGTDSHMVVFITSERKDFDKKQLRYSIRIIKHYHGDVRTVGDYNNFYTLADARAAAKAMIADGTLLKELKSPQEYGSLIDELIEDLNQTEEFWAVEYGTGYTAILRNQDGFEYVGHLYDIYMYLAKQPKQ